MSKMLVMLTTGKDDVNSEMVAFSFAFNAVKNAKAEVELLFLGRGVQAANKNQKNSPQFLEQVNMLKAEGIPLRICKVSMAGEGLKEDDIFPDIDMVFGGVETDRKIDEGYTVITF
ncbi:MAG: DsrE family protein [Nitrososphaerota archaeon]|nr:DsrE family protein [Nitrososphaerota archaeon]MDG7051606.1 DsrE family protein [Nitrososphaerota archaeon]